MTMTPGPRKLMLTLHVTSSVGWIGAISCFLALAIAGLASEDVLTARAAYIAINLTYWYVIVPLGLASPLTGLVSSLGTEWGLVRALLDSGEISAEHPSHHPLAGAHAAS